MSAEDKTDQISDSELFDQAIAKEPITEAAPKEETTEAKAERDRDEKGRFKAKDDGGETPPAAAEATPPVVEQPKEEKPDHRIPLTELLNEREKRQNAEREREATRQQLWQLQQQLQQAQQPKPEPIDIFADPDAYKHHVEQSMEQRLRAMEGNFSLRLAAYKHGDTFHEAWGEMISRTQMGDDSLRQQVIASPDPGETLVQLYQREKVVKEVGTDPTAYRSKLLDDALKDPQFLARALEAAKGVASTQPTQKIDLPPSLNKVAAAASAHDLDDASDRGMYSFATRR